MPIDDHELAPHLSREEQDTLWQAVHAKDLDTVRQFLEPLVDEPDTDVCQFRRITALHVAARLNLGGLVDRLVAAGATVGMSSIGGQGDLIGETPLHCACHYGHVELARSFIEAGTPVNALEGLWRIGGFKRSCLAIASHRNDERMVRVLLGGGAHPDGAPSTKEFDLSVVSLTRPLAVASALKHVSIVRLLLASGADPDLQSAIFEPSRSIVTARALLEESDDAAMRESLQHHVRHVD